MNEKKKYTVHFMGYFGYDIEVEAETEEEAIELAEPLFDEVEPNEFYFEVEHPDVWETR